MTGVPETSKLKIHLCVCGGIAAYKTVDLVSTLQKKGHTVRVAMSQSAQSFVGPLTFQGLTGHEVFTSLFEPSQEQGIGHIDFAQKADLIVIAPATANMLAKAALGIGDDLISTILVAANLPLVFVPAMNTEMWLNPAIAGHVATLRARGHAVLEPDEGPLACGAVGPGRLPETARMIQAIESAPTPRERDLGGLRIVIAGGPTREFIDPVRFLSNPSSGKTALALGREAVVRGAQVTLVLGPGVAREEMTDGTRIDVVSAQDMHDAVLGCVTDADVVIMSAAVSDWTPDVIHEQKMKKSGRHRSLEMVRTPDILAALGAHADRERFTLVGFAAETERLVENAREKCIRKGADLIVANDVSDKSIGFGTDDNEVVLVTATSVRPIPRASKSTLAGTIMDAIRTIRTAG
ncbi:MAG: bifunctional phosphopantothenoylcysteine decarboxylase/phosphopantothenate--cysteine ligase CoaBC [Bradymonadia bacterium]